MQLLIENNGSSQARGLTTKAQCRHFYRISLELAVAFNIWMLTVFIVLFNLKISRSWIDYFCGCSVLRICYLSFMLRPNPHSKICVLQACVPVIEVTPDSIECCCPCHSLSRKALSRLRDSRARLQAECEMLHRRREVMLHQLTQIHQRSNLIYTPVVCINTNPRRS